MKKAWYASRVIQKVSIIVIVMVVSGGVFYAFSDRLLVDGSLEEPSTPHINEALLNDLQGLDDRFNTGLFTDPRFTQLQPYNEAVSVPSAGGRDNPFEPPEDVVLEETLSPSVDEIME